MSDSKPEKTPAEFKKAETFRVAPISEYDSFSQYLGDAEKIYAKLRSAFMDADVSSDTFPEKAEAWAKASQQLIEASAALYNKYPQNSDNKRRALELLDRCKKDSGIREKNMMLHYELIEKAEPDNPEKLNKLLGKVLASLHFFFRAENTQMSYLRRLLEDPEFENYEIQAERRGAIRAEKREKMVPKGHMFLPARPFPPVRVPEGMRVPYPPDPFKKWKELPVEAFVFDKEHDEFVLPEGYVSDDGLIDDKSVVWDWENRLVTMKFRGGEPVT